MPKQEHIHLYKRVDLVPKWKQKKYNRESFPVFRCMKPTCSHWIRADVLALGKLCECNVCHGPMILDKESVKQAKPKCPKCIIRKIKPEILGLEDLLKDI